MSVTNPESPLRGWKQAGAITVAAVVLMTGCRRDEMPVFFELTVPEENSVRFEAELTRRYGLGLDGEFEIDKYGTIFVHPETPDNGFQFGFQLHTSVFHHDNWVNYREVETLPTGAPFPVWMTGPVVDVEIPPANTPEVGWHFYFGTRERYYLGAAAVITALDGRIPSVNVGYTFYDNQGRVVLGLQFFGPRLNSGGGVIVPGGIFIGTDITPFVPEGFRPAPPESATPDDSRMVSFAPMLRTKAFEMVRRVNRGEPVRVNGESVVAEVRVSGRERRRYRSERRIRGLVDRFIAETRK